MHECDGRTHDQDTMVAPLTPKSTEDQGEVVNYESKKREIKIRLMNEGRCDERLKARVEESTCLTYTGLHDKPNQKYLEMKMRSTSEESTNVMGKYTIQTRW
jgi:hypothetical protein